MLTILLLACADKDTGDSGPELSCLGEDTPTIELGTGVGDEFAPLAVMAEVGLSPAPQGGFGVPVRLRTTGLRVASDTEDRAIVEAQLDTYLGDTLSASFLNQESVAYCQADGTGLMDGLVVGFDEEIYTSSTLVLLDGETVTLTVIAFDTDGRRAEASIDVVIAL